jgi:hypothetical protein
MRVKHHAAPTQYDRLRPDLSRVKEAVHDQEEANKLLTPVEQAVGHSHYVAAARVVFTVARAAWRIIRKPDLRRIE